MLLILALVLAAMAPPDALAQDPAGTAPGRPLEIDLVAVDRNGTPVEDLRPQDVEVWIGGYRVPIDNMLFVAAPDIEREGRRIVLLLDDITVPPMLVPRVREAARRFVTRMGPGDEIAIVSLSGDAMKPTADRDALLRRVNRYNVGATGVQRVEDLGAQVLTSVAGLARQFAEAPGRRKTFVGIGSGWLLDTPMPPPSIGRDLNAEWVDAMRAMAFSNASFYVIDVGGVGTSRANSGREGFARETGGHAFLNTNDLNGAVDRIIREATTYYVIRLTDPPAHRKAPLRQIEVRSLRRGITIRARRGIPGTQS